MDLLLPGATVYLGDCVERMRGMADGSVQMCVTSPPYFGLRDYGHDGQIGLEETPEAYITKLVEVFREVRRVLADDGTLWVNIGDSYSRSPAKGGSGPGGKNGAYGSSYTDAQASKLDATDWLTKGRGRAKTTESDGVKHKDLIGIPWMLAFALRADGWYLRSEIIWHKTNPMPESVTDRPTKAHETLFLLAKSPRYFYDSEAVKEAAVRSGDTAGGQGRKDDAFAKAHGDVHRGSLEGKVAETRNRRSVWTIATRPYKGAHFAVFPPALVEPCILAGTSARGHCPACGARWARQVVRVSHSKPAKERIGRQAHNGKPAQQSGHFWKPPDITDNGFAPTCDCGLPPTPDVVLDPFNGSGTTGQVALEHGRHYAGCELNADYLPLTDGRLRDVIVAKAESAAALAEAEEEAARQPDLFQAETV